MKEVLLLKNLEFKIPIFSSILNYEIFRITKYQDIDNNFIFPFNTKIIRVK